MAIRYRVIQYDGETADVEDIISRSVTGRFKPGTVLITAWEAQPGDIVGPRAGLPRWQSPRNRADDPADSA